MPAQQAQRGEPEPRADLGPGDAPGRDQREALIESMFNLDDPALAAAGEDQASRDPLADLDPAFLAIRDALRDSLTAPDTHRLAREAWERARDLADCNSHAGEEFPWELAGMPPPPGPGQRPPVALTAVRLGLPPAALAQALRQLGADNSLGCAVLALLLSSGWRPGSPLPRVLAAAVAAGEPTDGPHPWWQRLSADLLTLLGHFMTQRRVLEELLAPGLRLHALHVRDLMVRRRVEGLARDGPPDRRSGRATPGALLTRTPHLTRGPTPARPLTLLSEGRVGVRAYQGCAVAA